MLFSEIYSSYYNTVAAIISSSQKGALDSDSLYEIVRKSAFPESVVTIGGSLESGKWPLIKKDYTTNIKNPPTMPLSTLQKRWLKAVLGDRRIGLFVDEKTRSELGRSLEGVEPLFSERDFFLYDRYSDGDPYDTPGYREKFRTILNALHQRKKLKIEYAGRFDQPKRFVISPLKIEYSQKDDKFRLLSKIRKRNTVVNIARILKCELLENSKAETCRDENLPRGGASVTLEIHDERKALERVMLAFAHFEKSAVQVEENVYRLSLNYDSRDETELVVRVLSFGPMVKVVEPQTFVEQVRKRISKQMELMKKNLVENH